MMRYWKHAKMNDQTLYFKEAKADKICCAKRTCYFADKLLGRFSQIGRLSRFFLRFYLRNHYDLREIIFKVIMRFIRSAC